MNDHDHYADQTPSENSASTNVDNNRLKDLEKFELLEEVKAELIKWAKNRIWFFSILVFFGLVTFVVQQFQNFFEHQYKEQIESTKDVTTRTRIVADETQKVLGDARRKTEELTSALTLTEERAARLEQLLKDTQSKQVEIGSSVEKLARDIRFQRAKFFEGQDNNQISDTASETDCTSIDLLEWLTSTKIDRKQISGCGIKINDEDFSEIAKNYGYPVAVLKAIDSVEGNNNGFLEDGRPKILFERSLFHKLTAGKYDESNPKISTVKWGGYLGGIGEYDRLSEALALDSNAALQSTSWGRYQVVGASYQRMGFNSVADFVRAMTTSEREQLEAMAKYLASLHLDIYAKNLDWKKFARQYNGAGYTVNNLDTRLEEAYLGHKLEGQN
ncbi:N-acetylmuramidase family protein [Pseudomonas sp. WJP1]|uniref:N-acetylmuramidase family protein n=1 Tax=Pseudomonas sp. WJP1 TaxID=2986947 RepID=UPI00234BCFB1|nr:N-acetylmuramidase family protein [Pseudomonas sp. WJP1]WCM53368.1 N-acetylmuramidase family protein [Pseudomonas sp. WJP1]